MTTRVPLAIALALLTPILLAETAKPRDGSSSSHSSSADRHPSPSSSSHSSSSSTSSDSHSSSSSSSTPRTNAQARHPRPGSGHGRRSYGGYSYRPYGYGGYYGGYYRYGYPYYSGYWWDGYYSPPYYPYHNSYRDYGSLRVMVEPNKTRVYVDGYFAGVADDFDGIFQRLNVSPGRHEVTLKLEGYRSHRVRLYVPEDHTIKLRYDMVRGEGEDALDDRVGGPEYRWRDDARDDRRAERDADRDDDDREPAERPAVGRDDRDDDDGVADADAATLRLSVTPEDASIYVDGRFRGTGRQLDDLLMPPGKHRVEVVRPGFRTYDQELDVQSEEPLDLKIALDRL